MPTTKNRFHVDLIISNILLGMNFSYFISVIKHYLPFENLFFLQVAASALFFIPFALFSRKYRISWRDFLTILLVTVLIVYGGMYMLLWGAKYTNPIDASTIATLGPIFTLITASFWLHERITLPRFAGVLLAFTGASLLIFKKGVIAEHGTAEFGNLLVLLSVISVAINTVIIKPILLKLGTLVVMGWYFIIGLAITAPFFLRSTLQLDYSMIPFNGKLEIAYLLILGTILPSYLLYRGTEKLTAVHTALYRYLQPIVATIFAIWRGQESLNRINIVATSLIFVGIILVIVAYKSIFRSIKSVTNTVTNTLSRPFEGQESAKK